MAGAAFALGAAAFLTPSALAAKPKPSPRICPAAIQVGGYTCTLSVCGSDCVYTGPYPG